jgi:hypothetical protein
MWAALCLTILLFVAGASALWAQSPVYLPLATGGAQALVEAITIQMGADDTAQVHCAGELHVLNQTVSSLDLHCAGLEQPTEVPTATAEPTPTDTPSGGSIAPYASAPQCAEHDNRAWHGLWNEEQGCHYDHHHGDDPRTVNDLMGTQLFALMGGEISYPWQTLGDGTQPENTYKHAGYFWHVRRDMPCEASPCITAFRTLVHQHQTGRDATVRYHSYVFEAVTSDGGYFRFGGWADFGDLHSPEGTIVVNVPDNHDSTACNGAGRHKQHSPSGLASHLIWYGASQQVVGECHPRGFVTLSVTGEAFDITDPADPARHDDYHCWNPAPGADNTRCRANGTTLRPHLIGINMVRRWDSLIDPDGDGVANWTGSADRYGRLLEQPCAEVSLDCVPVALEGLRTGHTYGASSAHTANGWREYDIYFCGADRHLCAPGEGGRRSAGWSAPVP